MSQSIICFDTPGLLDLAALRTFGMSSKENINPIGYFGTGLKYALAILIRTGHEVSILVGTDLYRVGARRMAFRVDHFDVLTLTAPDGNTTDLPFTTELGKTWKVWQAFRELYSNTLDEDGLAGASDLPMIEAAADPRPDRTRIYVQGEEMAQCFGERDQIFLPRDVEPIVKTPDGEIYPGASRYLYYRGIRAGELPAMAAYRYNILEQSQLTEDRTFASQWLQPYVLARIIGQLDDPELLHRIVVDTPAGSFEKALPFNGTSVSNNFLRVVSQYRTDMSGRIGSGAKSALENNAVKLLDDVADHIELDPLMQTQLDRGMAFCADLGFPIEQSVFVVPSLGPNILGLARSGKIYLSRATFDMGVKVIAMTLLEERLHIKEGLQDESRDMQNFLLQVIASLGERLRGEPL